MPGTLLALAILNAAAAGWQALIVFGGERMQMLRFFDDCVQMARIRAIGGTGAMNCGSPNDAPVILMVLFGCTAVILAGMWLLAREWQRQDARITRQLDEIEYKVGKGR